MTNTKTPSPLPELKLLSYRDIQKIAYAVHSSYEKRMRELFRDKETRRTEYRRTLLAKDTILQSCRKEDLLFFKKKQFVESRAIAQRLKDIVKKIDECIDLDVAPTIENKEITKLIAELEERK